jgi:hypothetical protein
MGLVQSVQEAGEAVADKMKQNQLEMMQAQMERQQKTMQVQMMAVTRERTLWFGGATAALALALLAGGLCCSGALSVFADVSSGAARGKNVAVGLIPLASMTTLTAYQWDLGQGSL